MIRDCVDLASASPKVIALHCLTGIMYSTVASLKAQWSWLCCAQWAVAMTSGELFALLASALLLYSCLAVLGPSTVIA